MAFDSLDIFAEVGAALAGFATLAGVLRRDFSDRHIAFGVVELSLIAVVFSLLPRATGNLRISALLFLIVWSSAWANAAIQNLRHSGSAKNPNLNSPYTQAASSILLFAGCVFAVLVVLAVWPERAVQLYSSSLMCAVSAACLFLWVVGKGLFYEADGKSRE